MERNEEILMAVLPLYALLQLYIPQIGAVSNKQTVKIFDFITIWMNNSRKLQRMVCICRS